MAVPTKGEKVETQGAAGRRSTRLSISIPITISGKDAAGHTFKENTRTLIINKHGAKVATAHQLSLGAEITVENRALGRTAKGNVVWLGDKFSAKELYEIGVQLSEAQNVWGIEFPPDDWQEGPPIGPGGQRLETPPHPPPPVKPPAPAAAPPPPPKAAPPPAPKTEAKPAKAPPRPAPPAPKPTAPPASKPAPASDASKTLITTRPPIGSISSQSSSAATESALANFSKLAEEAAEADLRSFTEKLANLSNEFGHQTQANLQEAANGLEQKMLGSLEEQFGAFTEKLQASRNEIESLLTKFRELQAGAKSEVEKAQGEIQGASKQALQSALEKIEEKARAALESTSASFVEQTRKRVQGEAAATMDAFSKKASERVSTLAGQYLSKVGPELEARQKQLTEQSRTQIAGLLQAATKEFREKIQKSASEMVPSVKAEMEKSLKAFASGAIDRSIRQALQNLQVRIQQETVKSIEQNFRAEAEAYRKKLSEFSVSMLEAFKQKVDALHEDFGARLQKTLLKSQDKGSKDVSDKLQKTAEELVDSLAKQLQKVGEDSLDLVNEELKTTGSKLVEDALKQIRGATQASLDSLDLEAKSASEEYRGTLHRAFLETRERSAEDLQAYLQESLVKQRDNILKQLERGIGDSIQQAVAEVKAKADQAAKEASDTVNKQVGAAAVVLKDWEDQARERLQTQSQKIQGSARASAEALQKQLDEFAPAVLGKLRKESDRLLEGLREGLEQAAREFQGKSTEAIREKLQALTEEFVETSAAQLHKHADQNLELLTEQLRSKQQQVAAEAENLFRNTIANMLKMVMQPGFQKIAEQELPEGEETKKRR